MLETSRGTAQLSFKLLSSRRTTIRKTSLLLSPHKLHWIKLRGISGKPFYMEPFIASAQSSNRFPSMNTGLVPQKHDVSTEVSQKMAHKHRYIRSLDIFLLQVVVQPHAPVLGRNRENCDRGNPISSVEMMQDRCVSSRCPRSAHMGNEQKAAFIEKCQVGAIREGFFLSPATVSSSSALFPSRFFPVHDVPASGNSIPTRSAPARDGWDDSECQGSYELPRPHAVWSTDRCCNQMPGDPSIKALPGVASLPPKACRDVPAMLCTSALPPLLFERLPAIETQSLRRNQLVEPLPTESCPFSAIGSLVGAASPIASGCLEVS